MNVINVITIWIVARHKVRGMIVVQIIARGKVWIVVWILVWVVSPLVVWIVVVVICCFAIVVDRWIFIETAVVIVAAPIVVVEDISLIKFSQVTEFT